MYDLVAGYLVLYALSDFAYENHIAEKYTLTWLFLQMAVLFCTVRV